MTINKRHVRFLLHVGVILGFSQPLLAHHGLDYYDTSVVIEIQGQVTDFELSNPHSFLYVESIDSDGNVQRWEIQGGPASGLARTGLSKGFLLTKPFVKIKAFQSKGGRCYPMCQAAGRKFDFEK